MRMIGSKFPRTQLKNRRTFTLFTCITTTKNSAAARHRVPRFPGTGLQQLRAGLRHLWDHAELLQHTQVILVTPTFHHLASSNAEDVDPGLCELLACWGDAQPRSLVGAATGYTHDDLIPFSDEVLDGNPEVGAGSATRDNELFVALKPR